MKLNPDELDALTEIINIGVGRAAASLSEMASQKIILQIPRVEVFDIDAIPESLEFFEEKDIASVKQDFTGKYSGRGTLIFPKESAFALVNLLLGQTESSSTEFDDEYEGVLTEVGNILLNAILGSIATAMLGPLTYNIPIYEQTSLTDIFYQYAKQMDNSLQTQVVYAEASFEISRQNIQGQFLIFCKVPSISQLLHEAEVT
ncbi:MAG: chemotaxis protein CheC [candidate division Zixibacteria bacterium]|nr:chemotaxis protein CheC [candidate division Zixibacteria bacterium]